MLTKKSIIDKALQLAIEETLLEVKSQRVANALGCSISAVNWHFRKIEELRAAVVIRAQNTNEPNVLTQALILKHPALTLRREHKPLIQKHLSKRLASYV